MRPDLILKNSSRMQRFEITDCPLISYLFVTSRLLRKQADQDRRPGVASGATKPGQQRLRSVNGGRRFEPQTPPICFLSKINSRQSTASSLQPEWRSGEGNEP